ncbi:hypothetical protein GF324_08630, partial [bacterium]|nr:hypothetical protein [bacterium]
MKRALSILAVVWTSLAWSLHVSAAVQDSLALRFNQQLDTRLWTLRGAMHPSTSIWQVDARLRNEVTQRKLPGFEEQWKNDHELELKAVRQLPASFDLLINAGGQSFRDRAAAKVTQRGQAHYLPYYNELEFPGPPQISGDDTRIDRAHFRAGLHWEPNDEFEIEGVGGRSWDRQIPGSGAGPSLAGRLAWIHEGEDSLGINGNGRLDSYGQRQNHEADVQFAYRRRFGDAANRLRAAYTTYRNDLFINNSGTVVSREQDDIRVDNVLSTPLDYGFRGVYTFGLRQSNVRYRGGGPDAGIENDLNHRFSLVRMLGAIVGELYYKFAFEDREYGGSLILGRKQGIGAQGIAAFDQDTLRISYSTDKLTYDSPDSLERSDRDRLRHHVVMNWSRSFDETTLMRVEASVSLDHLVYLEAERSSDNRWNRIFRFRPEVIWLPGPGWNNRAGFEVLANYNVYDFDQPGSSLGIRSTAFRRWSAQDTLVIPLARNWQGEIAGRFDLEDRGRLL